MIDERLDNSKSAGTVCVSTDTAYGSLATGHAGAMEFPIGGPDGRGGTTPGPNPYDLLNASLAACTAMTIRRYAQRMHYPLTHVDVAVSFHHGCEGAIDNFERNISLEGQIDPQQRAQLLEIAAGCPVGRALGLHARIHTTSDEDLTASTPASAANYEADLEALSIPNIDPD